MDWIYWAPPVLFFAVAFAWHTWRYGWGASTLKFALVVVAILAGLVVQRLVFAG